MKKFICIVLCIMLMSSLTLTGCGQKVDDTQKTTKDTKTPQNTDKEVLEISWFTGGGGQKYISQAAELFMQKYPNIEIQLEVNPKNHEQLRPRFVSGNPPDIFNANGVFMDYFALVAEDKLRPLNDILETESPRSEGKFKDEFMDGVLDLGKKDGNYYLAPIKNIFHGLWYSGSYFKDNNWDVPSNYDEWLAVSEKIKSAGSVPLVYQGLYPYYITEALLAPLICSYGGVEAINNISNLEPNAWKQDAVLKAVTDLKNYVDKYLYDGTLALNHTQAQMEFISNRSAFITCGNWLENEMKGNWPDNFDLRYLVPPVNKDNQQYVYMQVEYMAIPSEAKNPEAAENFLKMMYSQEMIDIFAEQAGITVPVKNNTNGLDDKLPRTVIEVNRKVFEENIQIFQQPWIKWYKPLHKKLQDTTTSLVQGKVSPQQFCEQMEQEAEKIRKDDTVPKYSINK